MLTNLKPFLKDGRREVDNKSSGCQTKLGPVLNQKFHSKIHFHPKSPTSCPGLARSSSSSPRCQAKCPPRFHQFVFDSHPFSFSYGHQHMEVHVLSLHENEGRELKLNCAIPFQEQNFLTTCSLPTSTL